MQEYEKGFIALAVMGALIALGKLLNSDEPITLRLVAGRVTDCRGGAVLCTGYSSARAGRIWLGAGYSGAECGGSLAA